MRTTVRIKDNLLLRANKRAADEERTLTSLIVGGLVLILTRPKTDRRKWVELLVSEASGGVLPGVDLNRSGDLEEVMGVL